MGKLLKPTGTREWSCKNVNIQQGCEHGCLYCYAMKMAKRFNRIQSYEDWIKPKLTQKIKRYYQKYEGMIMMPSAHDITPNNIDAIELELSKLIDAGNKVLLVTKPHLTCIQQLVAHWEKFKDQIEFRFTIGSQDDEVLKKWEPYTTGFTERMECVKWTLFNNFKTSVSCEPLLDNYVKSLYSSASQSMRLFPHLPLIDKLLWLKIPCVGLTTPDGILTEIWIGAMQYTKNAPKLDYQMIYNLYKDNPRIRWKESFRKHVVV